MSQVYKMQFVAVLMSVSVSLSSAIWTLKLPTPSCAQQGLNCTVTTSNCMDTGWLVATSYTPSEPHSLQVVVDTRQDEAGHLHPVLRAGWIIKDDGSIRYLKATELNVLVIATNENLCVRYSFSHKLLMRNPFGKKWSFSSDMVVVNPGQIYRVSAFNIPRPEPEHSSYDVSTEVRVPDCQDPRMQRTYLCIQSGSFWQPDISVTHIRTSLTVSFNTHPLCDEYILLVSCSQQHAQSVYKDINNTSLNVTFDAGKWPRSCCQFVVEIKPLFPQCGQDCVRQRKTLDLCPAKPTEAPAFAFIATGVTILCAAMVAVALYIFCKRTPDKDLPLRGVETQKQPLPTHPPKVLVIYSQDHRLYRDIVLKLCAFLRAKCGTHVLIDLLDSTGISAVGPLRWLEWQRQQLNHPSDKILLLCSRGVQAKWRAMIGQGPVLLREDVLSSTDDILIPFLNLFLPDMQQAGMLGKYMVAYFDDVSTIQDVPSAFDIAVKYKLMKHFEELYFRLLDIEKYQPGQINLIEGIGCNEYFKCPSGKDLMNAIETFKAYQLENPNWFEMECVGSEEEVIAEAGLLNEHLQVPPVLECVPLIVRDGPPVYTREVEINERDDSVHVLTPGLNPLSNLTSVTELTPMVNPLHYLHQNYLYPHLDEGLPEHLNPYRRGTKAFCVSQPPPPTGSHHLLEEENMGPVPTEDEEEDPLLPFHQSSIQTDQTISTLQNSLDSNDPEVPASGMWGKYFSPLEISHPQPVEIEEGEVLEPGVVKGHSSGSDQGYMSKMSSQPDYPAEKDQREALEELFLQTYMNSNTEPEGN
ncbi:interleukin 17 receptor A1a [Genypterus blacodes]|uniref:interleukin 17 receptor A1a n=1 Tax=Genypterus blacodes TaxID=154954 RepID=UPI003F76806C